MTTAAEGWKAVGQFEELCAISPILDAAPRLPKPQSPALAEYLNVGPTSAAKRAHQARLAGSHKNVAKDGPEPGALLMHAWVERGCLAHFVGEPN